MAQTNLMKFYTVKPVDDPPQTLGRKKQRISKESDEQSTTRVDNNLNDSDSDDDHEENNASMIIFTIGGTVTRLFRLSNAIRKSAKASRARKIGRYRDDEEANKAVAELRIYTESYIRFRFPQAPEALCSALIEANALRLRRLYYQRSHRRRIALSSRHPQDLGSFQLRSIPKRASVIRFTEPPKRSDIDQNPKVATSTPAPLTNATTARQTAAEALYDDSKVGIPPAKSVLVNNTLSFPPVPTTSECPYCSVILEFDDSSKTTIWK